MGFNLLIFWYSASNLHNPLKIVKSANLVVLVAMSRVYPSLKTQPEKPEPKNIKILKSEPDKTRKLNFQNPKEKIIENVHF